ncbi:MAG: glucose 1-dehydrogenase [Puia sp.]|nr:glucose 1-dehydrogenase [Puia sp.]
MDLKLAGKVAIVTGASKGIGAGIARGLAAEGASVVVNYSNGKDGADLVVKQITAAGGKAIAIQGNVDKAADVKRLFEDAKKAFGIVNVVVNNAGVYQFDPVETITEAEFHRQFDINVLGPILTTREALKHFPETGGSIINISSVVSSNPGANMSVYAATKGAVDTLTKAHAKELAPRKIRVNTIAPGATETEGTHRVGMIGSDFEKALVASTPLGRLGQPEDIAAAVVFLASDAAGWITGDKITPSGGL